MQNKGVLNLVNVLISGASGRMGRVISDIIKSRDDMQVVAGLDMAENMSGEFPIYESLQDVNEDVNCIVDFSHPLAIDNLIDYALDKKLPLVLCTTGYDDEQISKMKSASQSIPVFFSMNMSLGINMLIDLAKKVNKVFGNQFDIEIIEKHHNQKIDAPSGTAYMIADAINSVNDDKYHYEYNRNAVRKKRDTNEIGIHAIRGGTIVGEHEVLFAGRDEVLKISHTAMSREIFAVGAVNAIKFLSCKNPGMYSMSDMM